MSGECEKCHNHTLECACLAEEKKKLLKRRKELVSIEIVDMSVKEMKEFERVVRRLNEIELHILRNKRAKKRIETGLLDTKTEKTGLDT